MKNRSITWLVFLLAIALLVPATADAMQRNFDARQEAVRGVKLTPAASQDAALNQLQAQIPNLEVRLEPTTGAARTISNRTGYLTADDREAAPLTVGLSFVQDNLALFGLTPADLEGYEVRDSVFSKVSGATHLYLVQRHAGIPVYNGQLHLNVNRNGRLISVNNAFLPELSKSVNSTAPRLTAVAAVNSALRHLGLDTKVEGRSGLPTGTTQTTLIPHEGVSQRPITAQLMWLPVHRGNARLVWNFQIWTLDSQHSFDFNVDAMNGKVWTRFDWTSDDSYRVYAIPAESPNHVTPLPPSDGRTLVVSPADSTASPFGWHDTNGSAGAEFTIHRGNNVHAYDDRDNNNSPPSSEPDCGGSIVCDFSLNLTQAPNQYIPAAVANLFYWNNIIHDVQYQYGFDEQAGNFQENNYGNGGSGSDSVNAEAQDGSGSNNANMATPPDGSNPRMQMYVWTAPNPDKDGDLDNGIIIHEYGHGISIRQVGGPSTSSCLNNTQQAGEGWSDWWSLAYTAETGDAGTDPRGIGTYALDQATSGPGIRTQRYSTDSGVNTWTYSTISTGVSVPHGVGAVWAQGIWEAYWALVDVHGYDSDIYNAAGGAGNQRMMLYVNEGLKNTACSPTFLDNRDGIIQAAVDNYGGADVCRLWEAFAAFGLGTDASTGGSGSLSATNGFSVPPECQCSPQPIADAGPDQLICQGDSVQIGTPAQTGNSYSWSPGGQTSAQITVSPAATTSYTVTATTSCGSANDSATVTVDDGSGGGLSDDFEGGAGSWSASGLWHLTSNSSCASPGYSSAVNAFYYGQDASCDYDTGGTSTGDLISPTISGITSTSTLSFDYYRVVESFTGGSYDQAEVAVSGNGGSSWTTLWSRDSADASTASWQSSGNLSLSAFAGQAIQVRFRFNSVDGVSNTFTGWFIDDVVVTGESACGPGNTPPTVSITAPADGSSSTQGDSVSFAGSANDAEDGNITASLSWSSSIDGAIGSGGSFSTSGLSVGSHTITASVTDSDGAPGSDSISVNVNAPTNDAPVVNITAPADGSNFDEGTSVSFSGTANDTEDGTITASLSWSSDLDGSIGSGGSFSTSSLSVGNHTITASVTDSGGAPGSDSISVTINAVGGGDFIDFDVTTTVAYSNQDTSNGSFTTEDGGFTFSMTGNRWRRTSETFTITSNTVIEFDFLSTEEGEIHGIGFDEDDTLTNDLRIFNVFGTQNWASDIDWSPQYTTAEYGTWKSYSIPVGQYYTGSGFYLVLVNDKDTTTYTNTSKFRNVRIYEDTPPPGCITTDFSSGASGWTNSGSSTCSTGSFVAAAPTEVVNGGVTTQVGGDHTGGGNAYFTATNTSAGVNDVDGGNCIAESSTTSVAEASDVSIWYFHGQRDAGDDPSGDFFLLEISTDGGSTWSTLASAGDVTSNAVWTEATTTVPAGSDVRFRVQASDGTAGGDLVEAGVDDISICPSGSLAPGISR
ncbi:MAG: M36 family metallopeptidase [Acidobacteriota bacterium]|nr:M36 family metallopeptidase [Acidobacteriota bacterium]